MGAYEDYKARYTGSAVKPRRGPTGPRSYDNFVSGAGQSLFSAVPELFGENPTEAASEFRERNPVSGFITEVIPGLVGGGLTAASVARAGGLRALESQLAKRGLSAAEAPIRNFALKSMAAEAPFEIGRGAIGTFTAPDENVGDLWGSVALSMGAVGGISAGLAAIPKLGGKAIKPRGVGDVAGVDTALGPGYHLRKAQELGPAAAQFVNGGEFDDNIRILTERALDEIPGTEVRKGKQGKALDDLKESTPESLNGDDGTGGLNSLFRDTASDEGLDIRRLTEGLDADNRTLNAGGQKEVLDAVGKTVEEVASEVRYAREIRVNSKEAAKKLSEMLDNQPGMSVAGDGVWAGFTQDGMVPFIRRFAEAPPKGKAASALSKRGRKAGYGPNKIKKGDRFLVGMTDRPENWIPEGQAFASKNAGVFGWLNSAYRPGHQMDQFSAISKDFAGGITEADIKTVRTKRKKGAIQELVNRKAAELGLEKGETLTRAMEGLYDVLAPQVRKMGSDQRYSRLATDWRLRMKKVEQLNTEGRLGKPTVGPGFAGKQLHGGVTRSAEGPYGLSDRAILEPLTKEEQDFVTFYGQQGMGANEVADIIPQHLSKDRIIEAFKNFAREDGRFTSKIDETFKNSDQEGSIKWAPEFVSTAMNRGQWKAEITDAAGTRLWWTSANTKPEVERIAKKLLEEADLEGKKWKIGEISHATMKGPNEVEQIYEKLAEQLIKDTSADTIAIVKRALQKYQMAKFPKARRAPTPGMPHALKKGEEGRKSVAGKGMEAKDLLESRASSKGSVLKMAAHFGWMERYGDEMALLQQTNPRAYEDMRRMINQDMGISGPVTKFLDEKLQPVLGNILGGQPATKIMNEINKNSYLWTHAILNPSAALVNLSTPIMTTLPNVSYLSSRTSDELLSMFHIMPRFDGQGKVAGITGGLSPLGMLKEGMRMMIRPQDTDGLLESYARMHSEGDITGGHIEEFLGLQSKAAMTIKDAYKEGGFTEALMQGMTYMARKSEEYPRLVAFNVGYKMAKNMGLQGDQLHNTAVKIMNMSMYGYRMTDRSRLITGPLGSTWGLFKNFFIHYANDIITYGGAGLKEGNWGPLAWMLGSTTFVGGLGATPIIHFADGLAKWQTDSPDSYTWMNKNWPAMAEFFEYGFSGGLGMSLQSSVMMPGVDPMNDLGNFGNAVAINRAMTLGKAVGAAWDYSTEAGENPLANPNIRDQLMGALLPRAGNRAYAIVGNDYIKSMGTGYPAIQETGTFGERHDITLGERMLYAAGMTPTGVAEQQRIAKQLWKDDEASKKAINALGRQFADALTVGDRDEMTRIISVASMSGVKIESVLKSGRTIFRREQGDALSRYGPEAAREYGAD